MQLGDNDSQHSTNLYKDIIHTLPFELKKKGKSLSKNGQPLKYTHLTKRTKMHTYLNTMKQEREEERTNDDTFSIFPSVSRLGKI